MLCKHPTMMAAGEVSWHLRAILFIAYFFMTVLLRIHRWQGIVHIFAGKGSIIIKKVTKRSRVFPRFLLARMPSLEMGRIRHNSVCPCVGILYMQIFPLSIWIRSGLGPLIGFYESYLTSRLSYSGTTLLKLKWYI